MRICHYGLGRRAILFYSSIVLTINIKTENPFVFSHVNVIVSVFAPLWRKLIADDVIIL